MTARHKVLSKNPKLVEAKGVKQPLSKNTKLLEAKVVKQNVEVKLAPQVGLEPTTKRLTAARSTAELLRSATAALSIPCRGCLNQYYL